jgi:hypothetical protein
MTIETVTITGDATPYEVYGGLPAALHYLLAGVNDGAVAFRALDSDDQARMLIQATLFLDAQAWQGLPTSPAVGGTTLQWPRAGVVDANGNAVDSSSVPANIVNAAFELCALFADDTDLADNVDAGTNVKGVAAGSARVDFFVPTSAADGSAPLFPAAVQRLVAQYLGGAVDDTGGGVASGTDGRSEFADPRRFNRTWPW